MNLPTKLTILRIILIPIILFFMLPLPFEGASAWNQFILSWGMIVAAAIFGLASYTDFLDGHIARKQNLITNLGKFLDPIADKLLVIAVLIALVERGRISTVVPVIILLREFAVTGIRLLAATDGSVIAASNIGKAKTVSQIVAILMIQIMMGVQHWIGTTTIWTVGNTIANFALVICVILTIVSGWDYYAKNKAVFK